jgi:hypothetical protein
MSELTRRNLLGTAAAAAAAPTAKARFTDLGASLLPGSATDFSNLIGAVRPQD